jgi:hypothetical protein
MVKISPTKQKVHSTKAVAKKPILIKSVKAWRNYVSENWQSLKKQAESAPAKTPYQELVVIAFTPIMPTKKTQLQSMQKLIGQLRYSKALVELLTKIYADKNYKRTATDLALNYLALTPNQPDEQIGLDWLLMAIGTLSGVTKKGNSANKFTKTLLETIRNTQSPSAIRVQAGMISAGGNVIFAGQDVNIIQQHYQGNKAKLKSYLARLRTKWNIPSTEIQSTMQPNTQANLCQLYTPVDSWVHEVTHDPANDTHQLNEKRFQDNDKDKDKDKDSPNVRISVLEKIATNPLTIIIGGAGSGKSTLCQFIVTALAYACDPSPDKSDKSKKTEKINGLDLLGASWIHGPMLPLYVSLRDFCNREDLFPKTMKASSVDSLLEYIKTTLGSFAPFLEDYLTQTDVPTHGTLLVLDGLDEVYKDTDRMILQRIIEMWSKSYPSCRIIVTSRTYAYRQSAQWRLPEQFISAELAPFTQNQMSSYIENWYTHLAQSQSRTWSGRDITPEQADAMAKDLINTIHNSTMILPLARQPMLLVLLTVIHEDRKRLPTIRAKLYEETIELLDRWKTPLPGDQLHKKLENMDRESMGVALKMLAFDLQSQQKHYRRYPTTISRGQLLDKLLLNQQGNPNGLGVPIEDVLDYLATRNGILVSDTLNQFRFAHLTIQEYLSACALIDFFDECQMPNDTQPSSSDGWMFPDNIVALLHHDYSRWHNVALFTGSILAAGTGQGMMRWHLIEKLLPVKIGEDISSNTLHCICVAAEIWLENFLKVQVSSQGGIKTHLTKCLKAIKDDGRVDVPDRIRNQDILERLEKDDSKPSTPSTKT